MAQNAAISQKDCEIAALRAQLAELVASIADQVQQAVTRREEELRSAVLEREKIVELGFQRREEEIMEAVRVREAELFEAWQRNEATLRATCRAELEAHWCTELENFQRMKEEMEEKARAIEEGQQKDTIHHRHSCRGSHFPHRSKKRKDAIRRSQEHPCTTCTAN
jgi:NIMA (never in mitosis gene a)-related kinase